MVSILTQAKVFQETAQLPASILASLRPHIAGGQADLHRYADAVEKLTILLGSYDEDTNTDYAWPNRIGSSLVDLDYVRVFIDEALLFFYEDPIGSLDTIAPVAGHIDRIATNGLGFKKNGSFNRAAGLFDRDVVTGDVVFVSDGIGNDQFTFVHDLIADVVAASIASATADGANTVNQGLSSSIAQSGVGPGDITATRDVSTYNGLATGDINDTYTLTITTGGNAAAARFSIATASGRDNATNQTMAAFASPTTIGTRGLKVTWSHTSDNFVIGQIWTVVVHQAFTAPTATSGGVYTGTADEGNVIYTITVTRGGKYTDTNKPQITVTTDSGTDSSGPTDVTTVATNVAVGTKGVLVQFNQAGLDKGDRYYIDVTAPSAGAYKTIVLGDNLITALQTATDLDLRLYINKASLEVSQNRISDPPNLNWVATADLITVNAGITAYDPTLTNSDVPFAVPVVSGPNTKLYSQYRAWLTTYQGLVYDFSVNPLADMAAAVKAVLGTVDPDNPLAYAVYKAAQNSNGNVIKFSGIGDPSDVTEWQTLLDLLVGLTDIYSMAPLTHLQAVHDAYKTHVNAQSATEVGGQWRRVLLALQAASSRVIIDIDTTTDGLLAKATVTDNPAVAGTQYTLVSCTTGNAKFVTKDVKAGDVYRTLFTNDSFGDATYSEFVIAQVINEDSLVLSAGPSMQIGTAQKFEIWRNQTKTEIADHLASTIEAASDKRVLFVWPDLMNVGSELVDGFYLTSALAGLMGAVMPHQGLKSVQVVGFDDATRSTTFFSNTQLNILAQAGCITVTKDSSSGMIYVKDDRTSDQSSVATGQEQVGRTEDAINYLFYETVAQFFGAANNTPTALAIIESELVTTINIAKTATFVDRLGSMIIDVTNLMVRPDVSIPDVVVIQATIERPVTIGNALIELSFI